MLEATSYGREDKVAVIHSLEQNVWVLSTKYKCTLLHVVLWIQVEWTRLWLKYELIKWAENKNLNTG